MDIDGRKRTKLIENFESFKKIKSRNDQAGLADEIEMKLGNFKNGVCFILSKYVQSCSSELTVNLSSWKYTTSKISKMGCVLYCRNMCKVVRVN